jgi:hypothetical protein
MASSASDAKSFTKVPIVRIFAQEFRRRASSAITESVQMGFQRQSLSRNISPNYANHHADQANSFERPGSGRK